MSTGLRAVDLPIPESALHPTSLWIYGVLSELSAVHIGLLAGMLPVCYAARLDPNEALRVE